MEYTAQALASIVGGMIKGDPNATISEFAKIEEAKPGSLTFLANSKYSHYLDKTQASIVLISRNLVPKKQVQPTLIIVENAYEALATLLEFYQRSEHKRKGRERPSFVHRKAKIGKNVYIGAFSYISSGAVIKDNVQIYPNVFIGENVKIGEGTILHSGVKIYSDVVIGKNCIIHAGTVIGSDGFGFAQKEDGTFKKIAQVGNVIIEDDVEIGANCAIDRATMGSTIIRQGVKLDNLVQVAHNVEIGKHTVIAAQVGLAGTTKIGNNCMIGGQAGFAGHLRVGDNVKIVAKSAITGDIPSNQIFGGIPAVSYKYFLKNLIVSRNLYKLAEELNKIKRKIDNL